MRNSLFDFFNRNETTDLNCFSETSSKSVCYKLHPTASFVFLLIQQRLLHELDVPIYTPIVRRGRDVIFLFLRPNCGSRTMYVCTSSKYVSRKTVQCRCSIGAGHVMAPTLIHHDGL